MRMAEMVRVGSGGEPSPEVGVSVESDPMLGGEESPGQRREASRWAPVEEALNRMVSFFLGIELSAMDVLDKGCVVAKRI